MAKNIKYNRNQAPKQTINMRNGVIYDSQMEAHVANALWYTSNGTHDEPDAHKFVILDPVACAATKGQYTTDITYTDPRTGKYVAVEVKGSKSFVNWPTVKKFFGENVRKHDALFTTFVCVFRNEIVVGDKWHYIFPEDIEPEDRAAVSEYFVRRGGLYKCSECGHSYFAAHESHRCPWCNDEGELVSENAEQVGKDLLAKVCEHNLDEETVNDWEAAEREAFREECARLGFPLEENTGDCGEQRWQIQDTMLPKGHHEPAFVYTEDIEGTAVYGHAAKYTTFVEVLDGCHGWRKTVADVEQRLVKEGYISRLVVISRRGIRICEKNGSSNPRKWWKQGAFFQCPNKTSHVFLSQIDDGKCPCCQGGGVVKGTQIVSRYTERAAQNFSGNIQE